MTKSQEKIVGILNCLMEVWELTPKKEIVSTVGVTHYTRAAGEAHISNIGWEEWMSACEIRDFHILDSILSLLKSEDLIESFYYRELVLVIHFPLDFEERSRTYLNLLIRRESEVKESPSLFPYHLKAGTRWENFILKFLDDRTLEIHVLEIVHKVTFEEMGFADGRNGKPNMLWSLLILFAKNGGIIKPESPRALENMKKAKSRLGEKLREYFPLEYDPFLPYEDCPDKRGFHYQLKSTLIPPSDSTAQGDLNIDDEIGELFREQSERY